jgi:hypothetical protein
MRTRENTHGRASYANFIGIPRSVADSAAFIALSQLTRALYVDLRRQYNGRNNGDISVADTVLAPFGWAHTSIHKGLKSIIRHGLMVQTRQGGIASLSRICSLYGFTDMPIMANSAKGIAGAAPSLAYREYKPGPVQKRQRKQVEDSQGERQGTSGAPMKVHGVNGPTPKVHAVNLEISGQTRAKPCHTRLAS